ncbi:PQQ-dependent sugar dehydrogenase [Saccharothrix sp. AJ9571]|nr:PQQ-dependent sugar dehydrogenase [Saccharothrix sp. AJ9571]
MSRLHPWKRLSLVVPLAVTALLGPLLPAAGGAEQGRAAGVPLDEISVVTTEVASGLQNPTAIVPVGDGRLLVTEKRGVIRSYHPSTGLAAKPVADLSARISSAEVERGLLGLALSKDRNVAYVAYTRAPDHAVTLARLRLDTGSVQELLSQEHSQFPNHNGGQVAFGSDGYLYWSIGDGGGAGDPLATGQKLDTLLGKILRLDVSRTCGAKPYCVPGDNPFVGNAGVRTEIWAYGLRNAWRFSFDPHNGSLWIGDVGQGRFEEVDHIRAHQGGVNFGWSCMEGPVVYNQDRCTASAKYTGPVFDYVSGEQGCAVIGGHVYRGRQYANLVAGTYVATDFCRGTAWAVRENPDGTYTDGEIGTFPTDVTAFGVDAGGELYVADEYPGRLHRVSFERTPARG